jgi:hypothetical protein
VIVMTYKIAMAASQDAGNRHAKKHGRTAWNEDDFNHAAKEFERLYGSTPVHVIADLRLWVPRDEWNALSDKGKLERINLALDDVASHYDNDSSLAEIRPGLSLTLSVDHSCAGRWSPDMTGKPDQTFYWESDMEFRASILRAENARTFEEFATVLDEIAARIQSANSAVAADSAKQIVEALSRAAKIQNKRWGLVVA